MTVISNPILPGFNPDPSMIRVGEDYYIATSTFEWYPGVQIFHSKDLVNWTLITRPVTKETHINMTGNKPSCGVWAPCLSYSNGKFYLIYSDVKNNVTFFDVHNYLIVADSIMGPWSDAIYLNSSGFDPSLFHDEDGRKWLVNMQADHRVWKNRFAGIVLQEYSEEKKALIGEPKIIFKGTTHKFTEGPHLYKRDGYYYLFCAEGGTSYNHCETVQRSKTIDGVYEQCPHNPLITSLPYPTNPLQKSGHASLVEGHDGNWYLVHLCSRPVGKERRCILGRETGLQKVIWENNWPKLENGTNEPRHQITIDSTDIAFSNHMSTWNDDFDQSQLNINFQTLRVPLGEKGSLSDRPGYLRLYGRESLVSWFEQSLLGLRQQHFCIQVDTKLDFQPNHYQQMAGLTYFYDSMSHYYAYITYDEDFGRVLTLYTRILDVFDQPIGVGIKLPEVGEIYLRVQTDHDKVWFSYSLDGKSYDQLGPILDATVISDDYYNQAGLNRFTGAFVAICCQDITGQRKYADFDFVSYQGK